MRKVCTVMAVCLTILVGCVSSERKAAELLETARFEEKQNNREHARQLYEEIIKKHPASAAAKDASGRLAELNRQPR